MIDPDDPLVGNAKSLAFIGGVSAVALTGGMPGASPGTLAEARTQFERRFIELALARANGSRTRAAAALDLSRQGLLKTMARLRIAAAQR